MNIIKPATSWAVSSAPVPNEQCPYLYYPLNVWACAHPSRDIWPDAAATLCEESACPIATINAVPQALDDDTMDRSASGETPCTAGTPKRDTPTACGAAPTTAEAQRQLSLAYDMLRSCVAAPFTVAERDQCQGHIREAFRLIRGDVHAHEATIRALEGLAVYADYWNALQDITHNDLRLAILQAMDKVGERTCLKPPCQHKPKCDAFNRCCA